MLRFTSYPIQFIFMNRFCCHSLFDGISLADFQSKSIVDQWSYLLNLINMVIIPCSNFVGIERIIWLHERTGHWWVLLPQLREKDAKILFLKDTKFVIFYAKLKVWWLGLWFDEKHVCSQQKKVKKKEDILDNFVSKKTIDIGHSWNTSISR